MFFLHRQKESPCRPDQVIRSMQERWLPAAEVNGEGILTVVYCFENDIELETLLCEAEKAFVQFAGVYDIDTWIA